MMNKRNNSRELNKCIRSLFDEGVDKFYKRVNNGGFVNCFRYNNELCNGYKIVWKSYGWNGYKKVWEYVLSKVNKIDSGWVLVESGSNRGDGSVYGMSKEYRNLELNKK